MLTGKAHLQALHDQAPDAASSNDANALVLQVIGLFADSPDVPSATSYLFVSGHKVAHEHKDLQQASRCFQPRASVMSLWWPHQASPHAILHHIASATFCLRRSAMCDPCAVLHMLLHVLLAHWAIP